MRVCESMGLRACVRACVRESAAAAAVTETRPAEEKRLLLPFTAVSLRAPPVSTSSRGGTRGGGVMCVRARVVVLRVVTGRTGAGFQNCTVRVRVRPCTGWGAACVRVCRCVIIILLFYVV